MEETFVIILADDSESDSSDVDIAGCDFYQNIENKYEKQQQQQTNKQTNKRKEKCILIYITT